MKKEKKISSWLISTIIILMLGSYILGYFIGRYDGVVQAFEEFSNILINFSKYVDIKITANLSINQTKLVEDMLANPNFLNMNYYSLPSLTIVNESTNPKGETSLLLNPLCKECKDFQMNKSKNEDI